MMSNYQITITLTTFELYNASSKVVVKNFTSDHNLCNLILCIDFLCYMVDIYGLETTISSSKVVSKDQNVDILKLNNYISSKC